MLALSALHLHVFSPKNADMALALRRYLDRTLVDHRRALTEKKGLSEQLWLSAVLLSHVYWLLVHQRHDGEAFELPLQAFKMLEGVGAVFSQNKTALSGMGYKYFGDEDLPLVLPDEQLSASSRAQLREIEDDLSRLFELFCVHSLPEKQKDVYQEARDFAAYHYRAFYSGAPAEYMRRLAGFMPIRCSPGFRDLLAQNDPLAMALTARLLVMLCSMPTQWWMSGAGEYEVVERDVRGMCQLMPAECMWTMTWPLRVLEGQIVLSRDEK
jgi:hypothetical protein